MLARSSNLALISTTTTTCLPASAASISASTIGDCEQPAQVERAGYPVHRAVIHVQLGDQPVQHVRRHRVLDLEPDRGLEPAPHQFPLHGLQQVLSELLV